MPSFNQLNYPHSIGDSVFIVWFITAAYLISALLATRVYFMHNKLAMFWLFIAIVLFCLGIDKQLDFQARLAAMVRFYINEIGQYEDRRKIQTAVIIGIFVSGIFTLVMLAWCLRDGLKENALAILGIIFLIAFTIIRTVSLHAVDAFLMTYIMGLRINSILELLGLFLIAGTAFSIIKKDSTDV